MEVQRGQQRMEPWYRNDITTTNNYTKNQTTTARLLPTPETPSDYSPPSAASLASNPHQQPSPQTSPPPLTFNGTPQPYLDPLMTFYDSSQSSPTNVAVDGEMGSMELFSDMGGDMWAASAGLLFPPPPTSGQPPAVPQMSKGVPGFQPNPCMNPVRRNHNNDVSISSNNNVLGGIDRRASVPNLGSWMQDNTPRSQHMNHIAPDQPSNNNHNNTNNIHMAGHQRKPSQQQQQQQPSSTVTPTPTRTRARSHSDATPEGGSDEAALQLKRLRNTEAARRSRLRRVARMDELEARIKEMEAENHRLVLRVASLENERVARESKSFADEQKIRKLEGQLSEAARYVTAARRMKIQMQRYMTALNATGNGGWDAVSGSIGNGMDSGWLSSNAPVDINPGMVLGSSPESTMMGSLGTSAMGTASGGGEDLINDYGVGFG
ncbi:uncharacterized protein SPPG_07047 [Spizellomyces punctatus DAOM BR117]|uniref:BZIP domain-containing protein n=1 Tax=Spizellomyces punctatus (strain DAOM BR117) TaxID=645134 RepID=A0A0L0H9K1_SPIPD|nr:uncharacterized protein SPPG_07047 [Spizellomyces punctatus DAOM BR117]KNC97574.1 hypothetical protein SPPG_07047 [Spizellomyces punctatus DAOM BR117]|eukprot:XP_016605614.1 hypothetical protein SPPG_07047 [Spizellomyces punctatus DAOM BR117]